MPASVDPEPDNELARAMARQRVGRRRVAVAALAIVAGVVTAACTNAEAATPADYAQASHVTSHNHSGTGTSGSADSTADPSADASADATAEPAADDQNDDQNDAADTAAKDTAAKDKAAKDKAAKGDQNADENDGDQAENNGLDVIGRNCDNSKLPEHTGFQVAPACVTTEFGEVAAADKSPSLLITDAPSEVTVGQAFTLKVSTRNLVRDRFLGAAAGGYYLESSFLNADGIQRGHFHTACRMLQSVDEAPDSSPAPAFFLATQDNKGGAGADTVDVQVTGLPSAGIAQCTSWAGDGSHRIPMMERANQTPAVDSVRIVVK